MLSTVTPERRNLTLYQGMDFRRCFFWTLDEPEEPVNLTGYSARLELRKTPAGAAALTLHSGVGGGITLGPPAGEIWVDFEHPAVLALIDAASNDPVTYLYDLRLVDPNGEVIFPVYGTATVSPRITRSA